MVDSHDGWVKSGHAFLRFALRNKQYCIVALYIGLA